MKLLLIITTFLLSINSYALSVRDRSGAILNIDLKGIKDIHESKSVEKYHQTLQKYKIKKEIRDINDFYEVYPKFQVQRHRKGNGTDNDKTKQIFTQAREELISILLELEVLPKEELPLRRKYRNFLMGEFEYDTRLAAFIDRLEIAQIRFLEEGEGTCYDPDYPSAKHVACAYELPTEYSIVISKDLAKDFNKTTAMEVLFHEAGHFVGITDHRYLDAAARSIVTSGLEYFKEREEERAAAEKLAKIKQINTLQDLVNKNPIEFASLISGNSLFNESLNYDVLEIDILNKTIKLENFKTSLEGASKDIYFRKTCFIFGLEKISEVVYYWSDGFKNNAYYPESYGAGVEARLVDRFDISASCSIKDKFNDNDIDFYIDYLKAIN